jgi:hypothetical protein
MFLSMPQAWCEAEASPCILPQLHEGCVHKRGSELSSKKRGSVEFEVGMAAVTNRGATLSSGSPRLRLRVVAQGAPAAATSGQAWIWGGTSGTLTKTSSNGISGTCRVPVAWVLVAACIKVRNPLPSSGLAVALNLGCNSTISCASWLTLACEATLGRMRVL